MTNNNTTKRAAIVAGTIGLVVLIGWIYFAWGKPPQMGPDDEVFSTVDALFTAVTAHDERLLEQCTRRLQVLSEAGKLPREASNYLDGIIATARIGCGRHRRKLYVFTSLNAATARPPHSRTKEQPWTSGSARQQLANEGNGLAVSWATSTRGFIRRVGSNPHRRVKTLRAPKPHRRSY